jgi:2'-5' RNA ligase
MASQDSERLFFALWPEPVLRDTLYKLTRKAVRASGGRPVPPENFHITLAFLGSLSSDQAKTAREGAASIEGPSFELILDRFGFWPEPRVVWIGARQVPVEGRRLAADLISALTARGLKPDPKPFVPHLTLARKVGKPGDLGSVKPLRWPVEEFALVRSVTDPAGSRYSVLQTWPLAARGAESVK